MAEFIEGIVKVWNGYGSSFLNGALNTLIVSLVGTIAGCYVTDGKMQRNEKVRIVRDSIVVFEGDLSSLKRFKDDAKEVAAGYECGLSFEKFNDVKVGDIIEAYVMEQIER